MKYSFLISFIILSFTYFGQTLNYFNNNPVWHCGLYDSDQWNQPSEPYTDDFNYYIKNDTNIIGFDYHHIFKRGYRSFENSSTQYDLYFDESANFYIRQEGNSIRYFSVNTNSDLLLASYNYNVGDSLRGVVFQDYLNDTIQKIDSILVNSSYHKRFYIDSINGPIITEGIGHQLNVDSNSGEFLVQLGEGIGFAYMIHCYGQNNTPYWDYQGNGGNCMINIGVNLNSEDTFQIYPIPAFDFINLQSTYKKPFQYKIYNLNGLLIDKGQAIKINISNLSSGLYILEVIDENSNSIGRQKFQVY